MEPITLQAEVRESRGKGPARRLRAAGKLPAVIYGKDLEPTPITIDPEELSHHLLGEYRRNTLFKVAFGGQDAFAMVKEVVVEPVSRELIHVDFYKVALENTVTVDVPITTSGRAQGVVKGGIMNVARRTVPVRCTPDKIIPLITIDVRELDIHQAFHVSDLQLGDGLEVALDPKLTLVLISEDRRAKNKKKDEEEAEEA